MAHVDFKVTDWERIEIPSGKEVEVKALLEKGEITSANDLYNLVGGCYKGHIDGLASEQLPIEENDYQPTIEMFDDVDDSTETVFSNGGETPKEEIFKVDIDNLSEFTTSKLLGLRDEFFQATTKVDLGQFEEIIVELDKRSL